MSDPAWDANKWEHSAPDRFVTMQSTGKKSMDDTEIYESDVLSFLIAIENYEYEHHGVVRWNDAQCRFVIVEKSGHHSDLDECVSNLQILGDIYRNPELLPQAA